jgi:hypothetical protein
MSDQRTTNQPSRSYGPRFDIRFRRFNPYLTGTWGGIGLELRHRTNEDPIWTLAVGLVVGELLLGWRHLRGVGK